MTDIYTNRNLKLKRIKINRTHYNLLLYLISCKKISLDTTKMSSYGRDFLMTYLIGYVIIIFLLIVVAGLCVFWIIWCCDINRKTNYDIENPRSFTPPPQLQATQSSECKVLIRSSSYTTLIHDDVSYSSNDGPADFNQVIDLHHLHLDPALNVVAETLKEAEYYGWNTIKIITGRGNHSLRRIPVLKPAVAKYLTDNGYSFRPEKKSNGGAYIVDTVVRTS